MSQRGGSVVTYVKYGEKVWSPIIDKGEADLILAFEMLEAYRALPYLKKGGKMIANTQEMSPMPVITGAAKYPENIGEKLSSAADVTLIDALALAREAGLIPHGDFRLNLCNEQALAKTLERGFADALLSPELSLPQVRDIGGACDCIVYGRVPLMLLEKCAGREVGSCEACEDGTNALVDRRGEVFPLLRLPPHRNILYNSRPTAMSDKQAELAAAKITAGHFIFSTEAPAQVDAVIKAYQTGAPIAGPVRRI
jgi:hypothetical protein